MTPDEAAIRAAHYPMTGEEEWCVGCQDGRYPCDAVSLIAILDTERAGRQEFIAKTIGILRRAERARFIARLDHITPRFLDDDGDGYGGVAFVPLVAVRAAIEGADHD